MNMRLIFGALAALILTGCTSFSEVSIGAPTYAKVDGDETPLASFVVCNVSYHFLHKLPICTGVTWKKPNFEDQPYWHVELFQDRATIDENLASVRAAMHRYRTDRVANLTTILDDESKWSLFLFRRRTIKTTCLIMAPSEEYQQRRLRSVSSVPAQSASRNPN